MVLGAGSLEGSVGFLMQNLENGLGTAPVQ